MLTLLSQQEEYVLINLGMAGKRHDARAYLISNYWIRIHDTYAEGWRY